ncbi:uncharacterized protein DNG_09834 [Cephalotrichum gorgonifer]|uniref:Uncharacterized protein n=1 Tax=Cephalotrichum gorgonifer TaxID=2041049 RepID=A0AAE8SZQ1_9PEZI|nr:uncharacterized protein DNG_09834 [Cephalotrichum gorgonifer]
MSVSFRGADDSDFAWKSLKRSSGDFFAARAPATKTVADRRVLNQRIKRQARIHELELKHENAIHQTTQVSRDEESRRLRLRSHLLRDGQDKLQQQLGEKNEQLISMTADYHQVKNDLQAAMETIRKQETQIKSQARDFTHLQTELKSLESVSQDSAKLLAEKLAVTRELNVLKPELEHFKSQLSHQQSVVAEKLALERQLNSLEVELEAVKRSKQRAQRDEKDERDELRARVEDLEKKLEAEKKDKDRVRKDGERSLAEATAQNEMLEERLGTMKMKLRQTREELKKCQAELSEASMTAADVSERSMTLPAARKQTMKRKAEVATTAISIETPHADDKQVKRALKKRALDATQANVGEKSTFSITPFLNRSKGVDESLEEDDVDQSYIPNNKAEPAAVVEEASPEPVADAVVESTTSKPAAKPKGRPRKVLGEISTAKTANATKRPQGAKADEKTAAPKVSSGLENVAGEAAKDVENQSVPAAPVEKESSKEPEEMAEKPKVAKRAPIRKLKTAKQPAAAAAAAEDHDVAEPEQKKKKRKLVGGPNKTLFDEDDAGVALKPAPMTKVSLGPRRLGAAGPALAAVKRDAFGAATFSPLKKHRRGVNASFLA